MSQKWRFYDLSDNSRYLPPGSRKRRFSHLHEKLCEKNDAAAQADSANQAKSYVRKISAFVCSTSRRRSRENAESAIWKSSVRKPLARYTA
jgi:hypothetical protein